ncbi:MAG: hypothetical protein JXB05_32120 [Myxococcaceae bacterium]|nr:hypothetical protein [Myxococcaceae bacterium]
MPAVDPVGDQLQAAARQATRRWSPDNLSQAEREAIRKARAQGKHWLARLLERQARGRFVENAVKDRFRHLQWSKRGVDVIDRASGYRYEILSGTDSNTVLHGRRMADTFFRMITF